MPNDVLLLIICGGAGLVLGSLVAYLLLKAKQKNSAASAQKVIDDAQREAEKVKKDAAISVKGEVFLQKENFEKETRTTRNELRKVEKRLEKREDNLDKKADLIDKKEQYLEKLVRKNTEKEKTLIEKDDELAGMMEKQTNELERISGVGREEAKRLLLDRLESDIEHESAKLIQRAAVQAKETAEKKAQKLIVEAIQRCSAECAAENTVSTIDLPNDDMKGRIIGREGRNIRAFEKATGVDVIVDDTPGVVVISGFDGVRREIARRAMEKLVTDGRIHPGRIEDLVKKTEAEVQKVIQETGEQTVLEQGLRGIHHREMNLLGRLRYRTSYGQNVLHHSKEVSILCGLLAGELKLNVKLAKRAGLLHDIGKAIDYEVEGSHPELGADIARRCDECHEIVNAIAAHHEDVPPESLYAILVQAADAISAARPGARRESLEKYIQRLEKLEEIANSYEGVEKSFAIQAGREVRVVVRPEKIPENNAIKLCRDIAGEIEKELSYPGEIKVTLIRETRVVEYAR